MAALISSLSSEGGEDKCLSSVMGRVFSSWLLGVVVAIERMVALLRPRRGVERSTRWDKGEEAEGDTHLYLYLYSTYLSTSLAEEKEFFTMLKMSKNDVAIRYLGSKSEWLHLGGACPIEARGEERLMLSENLRKLMVMSKSSWHLGSRELCSSIPAKQYQNWKALSWARILN